MHKGRKRLLFLIACCAIVYFLYTLYDLEKVIASQESKLDGIEVNIQYEKAKNEELLKQKDKVNSNQYVEKMAREKLGMVKPGEKIFIDMNK